MDNKPLTTAEMLAALGWAPNANNDGAFAPSGEKMVFRLPDCLWHTGEDEAGHKSFEAAVEAAYKARFPKPEPDARQPLDAATFGQLLEEGSQNMRAFEAERRAGFPVKVLHKSTAGGQMLVVDELNRPIEHTAPSDDVCQTSELDSLRAENERLRTLANKRGERGTELLTVTNRQHAAEKLLGPVATYLGGHWTVQVGDLPVLVAWLEG